VLRDLTEGSGYDLVVDATGAPAVAEVLVPLTRNGGTCVFYGVTADEDRVAISPYDVFRRELTIKGSFAEISSFPAALAALRAGRARTAGLITHRFGLGDYGLALETLRSDRTAHQVVVVPWGPPARRTSSRTQISVRATRTTASANRPDRGLG
jgi:D-arabinitol dehydrogenase (NADP+)